ncbi:Retrovirus-related Pol polyprotein from transposon 17.6, partial [Dictyocoela muelleri]
ENIELKTASNQKIESTSKALINLNFEEIPNAIFNEEALIIENLPVNVILGNTFLTKNNSIINFHDSTLQLSGLTINFNTSQISDDYPKTLFNLKSKKIIEYIRNEIETKKLGIYKFEKHKIHILSEPKMKSKQYQVPYAIRNNAKEHIKNLLGNGIITKSTSPYCSPAFFIPKKNNELRLVIDYSELNNHTRKEVFPCANIQECLLELSQSKIFSSIDLNMGYHQIVMEKESRKFTSFIILNEQYEYVRMPFGLTNAPRTFQRVMQNILGNLDFVKIYLDDVLIHSINIEEHENQIKEVIKKLSKAGLSINLTKSDFYKTKIEYLGHYITPLGYYPKLEKIELYKRITLPKTKKKLQKLIGIINWFRPFISGISNDIIFLTDKLKNDIRRLKWQKIDQIKLQKIWGRIENAPRLSYPKFDAKFFLEVDASDKGIGEYCIKNMVSLDFIVIN